MSFKRSLTTKELSSSQNDFDVQFQNWQGDFPHWTNIILNFLEGSKYAKYLGISFLS